MGRVGWQKIIGNDTGGIMAAAKPIIDILIEISVENDMTKAKGLIIQSG